MRKTLVLAMATAFVCLGTATALASATPIADVLSTAPDSPATMTGTIGITGPNEFTLTDSTGSIAFECGPAWYKLVELQVGETVTVIGEVDRGKDGKKAAGVDAFSVTKADGSTVEIRKGPGKPPWAGKGGPNGKGGVDVRDNDDADDADDSCND